MLRRMCVSEINPFIVFGVGIISLLLTGECV